MPARTEADESGYGVSFLRGVNYARVDVKPLDSQTAVIDA
jgi:hypothetical protein